jgi:hypothetical protein
MVTVVCVILPREAPPVIVLRSRTRKVSFSSGRRSLMISTGTAFDVSPFRRMISDDGV